MVNETPIAIALNGISFVVMLASPYDLDDFVYGLLLSEGVISNKNQIHDVQITPVPKGIVVDVTLANRQLESLRIRQRQLRGTSGCGLCGKTAIDEAFPELPLLPTRKCLSIADIEALKDQLPHWQQRAQYSGAMHAAFWINEEANILACREDIGRHNAVDKLVGYALKQGWSPETANLLVTSRCSVEIVQKAILCGVVSLITLASPTQLAVDTAREHNLHLFHIPKVDRPYQIAEAH
ncbi:formate dehydrogenase accessory sulfurtransferase FdhD [Alteromonas sediminis]|uniref:formate dehydrogenase accessory sulfurtransferase FdhD n=1 Tax=Alteromonas sediminis TaxID=2259342 RepID=UPI0023E8AF67|nr:formate dehydrogenase accessory sulfurtransferase FdhD [Alteromonas sediminis]